MSNKTKYQNDSLGTRMKAYEAISQNNLMKRTPVIIRLDGRAFHTFTKRLPQLDVTLKNTPYSILMHKWMMFTTQKLVENIQGCVFGYTQSDEISLLLRDWDTLETQAWFDNNVQKTVSISAAIATAAFNEMYRNDVQLDGREDVQDYMHPALFDSRVHNIPKEEVANYFIWRQQDASRNSVQMYGRHYFSQKEMHGKNNSQVQDMLMLEKSFNWNDAPTWTKRGSCVARYDWPFISVLRDDEIPVFTQDRNYIERHLVVSV